MSSLVLNDSTIVLCQNNIIDFRLLFQDTKDKSRYRKNMGFWLNVHEEMGFMGLTRKELAFKSGIPLTTIDKGIERDSDVSALTGLKIAHALDVSLEFLLGIGENQNDRQGRDEANRFRPVEKYLPLIKNLEQLSDATRLKVIELVESLSNEKKSK